MNNKYLFWVLMLVPSLSFAQSVEVVPAVPAQSGTYKVVKSLGDTVLDAASSGKKKLGPVTFVSDGELKADTSTGVVKFATGYSTPSTESDVNKGPVIFVRGLSKDIGNARNSSTEGDSEITTLSGDDESQLWIGYGNTKEPGANPGYAQVEINRGFGQLIQNGEHLNSRTNIHVWHAGTSGQKMTRMDVTGKDPAEAEGIYMNMGKEVNGREKGWIPNTNRTETNAGTNIFDPAGKKLEWREVEATDGTWKILALVDK